MSNNLNFGSNFEFEKIMRTKYFIVAGVAAVSGAVVTNSCMAVATSSIGLTIIKNIRCRGFAIRDCCFTPDVADLQSVTVVLYYKQLLFSILVF